MRGVVSRSSNASGAREVTASQLAGTGSGASNGTSNTNSASRRAGRTRRNRRRASQISTTSLPVYMKEPGDMELVIFRGPEPMDASDMIAEAREAEDAEETEGHDQDQDQTDGERDDGPMRETGTRDMLATPGLSTFSPDVSMQSLGVPSANGDGEEPDTSTTQLLRSASSNGHHRNDSAGTASSASTTSMDRPGFLHRVSEVPSEAPPGYESSSDHRHSASSANMEPPGLAWSSNAQTSAGPNQPEDSSPPRPRSNTPHSLLSSRISRILHLRSGSGASNMTTGTTNVGPGSVSSHMTAPSPVPEPPERAHVSETTARSGSPATNAEMAMHDNLTSAISLNDPPPPSSSGTSSHPPVSLGQHYSRHRSSQSGGSTSTLNLALPFRSVSRQRSSNSLARQRSTNTLAHSRSMDSMSGSASGSNANLTSPSLLSLQLAQGAKSISSPLSHTLVRTEIRYPAGGPTPDQIKLLSSREGFERFAIPYGEQAVAHARRSRVELELDPPPVFESPTTEVGRSAAREAREANERERDDAGDPRPSVSSEGQDPDAIPEGLLNENREAELAHSTLDARVFVPMFM